MTAHQTVALKELCCNPGRFIPSVLRQIDWMLLCGSSVFALQNWLSQQFSLPFQFASNRSPSLAKIQFNILIRRHNTFLKSRHFHLSFFFFFFYPSIVGFDPGQRNRPLEADFTAKVQVAVAPVYGCYGHTQIQMSSV